MCSRGVPLIEEQIKRDQQERVSIHPSFLIQSKEDPFEVKEESRSKNDLKKKTKKKKRPLFELKNNDLVLRVLRKSDDKNSYLRSA